MIHAMDKPPAMIKSILSLSEIVKRFGVNTLMMIATTIPTKLEKRTSPPEPRLLIEYLVTRYWSKILTNAQRNEAVNANKNQFIR